MNIEIVLLNYNGGELFLECLPSLVRAAQKSSYKPQLVILDNGSTDGSLDAAAKQYPAVLIVRAPKNRVLCSYNDYLKTSRSDVAVLLNNDISVDEGFIDPLIEHFEKDQDLFMVTSKCLSYDGQTFEGGITRSKMRFGIFWASSRYPGYEKDIAKTHPTMAAGYGAFSRSKFLSLDGYDDLYLPGRLEDSDLCFRAWKMGWVLLYEPRSIIYHKGGVSFHREFGVFKTLRINHRNSFLFVWKNISDPLLVLSHITLLPLRLLWAALRANWSFVLGFWDALPLLKKALERRSSLPKTAVSDRDIFARV